MHFYPQKWVQPIQAASTRFPNHKHALHAEVGHVLERTLLPGHTLKLGKNMGTFYIERLLGTGSDGNVYAVQGYQHRGHFALKILPLKTNPRHEIERHIKLQRRVQGDYVIAIYDALFTLEHAYILFECGSKHSLEVRLCEDAAQAKPLDIPCIWSWFYDMAQAVAHCHANNIVHGDIKPDNFIFSNREKSNTEQQLYPRVKLTDFGLSSESEQTTASLATITHMAPEQLRGAAPSFASDMWSLGVSLFRMLVGIEPYYDDTPEQMARRLLQHQPQFTQQDLAQVLQIRGVALDKRQTLLELTNRLLAVFPWERLDANTLLARYPKDLFKT